MKDVQEQKFQKMVDDGKMTQQQADKMIEAVDKVMTPTLLKIMGIGGSIFGSAAILFFVALIFWLLGKYAFHANFNYMKAVEVSGLALMITALGAILSMLLAVISGICKSRPARRCSSAILTQPTKFTRCSLL
jgi:uncharacterized membrane protein